MSTPRPSSGPATVFVNAEISGSSATTLRMVGPTIAAIGAPPRPDDRVLDVCGDRILPGLINAHDHLQLNGFGPLIYRQRYQNARQWIADVDEQLASNPQILAHRGLPRDQRLLLGGIKNILSGVTTVAHHDPLYRSMIAPEFPTRVVGELGWSHSLGLDGAAEVWHSHQATPTTRPWIIHAAEGTDAAAAAEFDALSELGCITANTLLVHALALGDDQQAQLAGAGAGIIWCPMSNRNLFGATLDVRYLIRRGRVALGSDSRLTGGCDLLADLRLARESWDLDEATLESLVTERAAKLLMLTDRGVLKRGAVADLVIVPSGLPLSRATRGDIRLVVLNGRPCYGDECYRSKLNAQHVLVPVRVDGRAKFLPVDWVRRLARCEAREPGLEWDLDATSTHSGPWSRHGDAAGRRLRVAP